MIEEQPVSKLKPKEQFIDPEWGRLLDHRGS